MTRADRGLLAQIENGALDSSSSLADTLRKCVALGGLAGSEELRDWARRELEGYRVEDELPYYRTLPGTVKIDGVTFNAVITGQQLSSYEIPEFAREEITAGVKMTQGIAELELIERSGSEVKLQHPHMQNLVAYMNSQRAERDGTITTMYWVVGRASVLGAIDAVRTNLVALVAEMRAMSVGTGAIPTTEIAERAVQVVIYGAKRSPITVNSALATGSSSASVDAGAAPSAPASRIPGWVRGPWGFTVGLATMIGAYAGIAAGMGWPPF
ncbi:AbiTii domain-containing protein [Arthrobacter sp. zg-Y179]|uniref:AbiTii domain-containing protein n=1 Tax=Arthrobacter sp. zg-Y179 TaxID=2894188 RepID=UPI002F3FEB4E|nr:hypothetical protein [Arthrobacter sp. zg-Y179]